MNSFCTHDTAEYPLGVNWYDPTYSEYYIFNTSVPTAAFTAPYYGPVHYDCNTGSGGLEDEACPQGSVVASFNGLYGCYGAPLMPGAQDMNVPSPGEWWIETQPQSAYELAGGCDASSGQCSYTAVYESWEQTATEYVLPYGETCQGWWNFNLNGSTQTVDFSWDNVDVTFSFPYPEDKVTLTGNGVNDGCTQYGG